MAIITYLLFIVTGIFYVVFAYREPPKAIDHFFRIDAIFIFLPERNRVRIGRIVTGVLIGTAGLVWGLIDAYSQIRWMIAG